MNREEMNSSATVRTITFDLFRIFYTLTVTLFVKVVVIGGLSNDFHETHTSHVAYSHVVLCHAEEHRTSKNIMT